MSDTYISDKEFKADELPTNPFLKGVYEHCFFYGCNLANQDLSHSQFLNCRFDQCDFSLANLLKTTFQKTHFDTCKLIGLRFDQGESFMRSFSFENCNLNLSSFLGCEIPNTKFIDCQLKEVDFSEAVLQKATFCHSNLEQAIFDQTNLKESDFRHAMNFQIDPLKNKLKKARFSVDGLPGLVNSFDIIIS